MSICTKLPVILSVLDYILQTTTTFGSSSLRHFNRTTQPPLSSGGLNSLGSSLVQTIEGEDLQTRLPDHLLSLLFLGTL